MSVESKKINVKKLQIEKAKKSEIFINVLKNFPDAELTEVNFNDPEGNND